MEPAPIDDELDLRHYIDVVNRRRIPLAATTVVVVIIAMALTFSQTPRYAASVEVLLRSSFSEQVLDSAQENNSSSLVRINVATEIEYMKSGSVEDTVAAELGYKPSVSIRSNGETEVVTIRATSVDPDRAAEAADTYALTYIDTRREQLLLEYEAATQKVQQQIDALLAERAALKAPVEVMRRQIAESSDRDEIADLQQQVSEREDDIEAEDEALVNRLNRAKDQLNGLLLSASGVETGGAQLITPAEVPGAPYAPTPLRNAVVAIVVGLILGVGVAFLMETLDTQIRSRADLERLTGWPVVGLIPSVTDWKQSSEAHLITIEDPNSGAAEAYRTLRTSLQFIGLDRQLASLLVTSSSAAEGKTTTLSNLGVSIARTGKRVILVDCDLRQPRLHEFFGLDNTVGFTSVLLGEADLLDAARPTQLDRNLAILPAGPIPPNPSEMLALTRTRQLIEQLEGQCDYLLIDTPPVLPVSDAAILAGYVDGVLVVADASSTRQNEIIRAGELLDQVGAPVVGSVINSVTKQGGGYGYGYGYYGSRYGVDLPHTDGPAPNSLFTAAPPAPAEPSAEPSTEPSTEPGDRTDVVEQGPAPAAGEVGEGRDPIAMPSSVSSSPADRPITEPGARVTPDPQTDG